MNVCASQKAHTHTFVLNIRCRVDILLRARAHIYPQIRTHMHECAVVLVYLTRALTSAFPLGFSLHIICQCR